MQPQLPTQQSHKYLLLTHIPKLLCKNAVFYRLATICNKKWCSFTWSHSYCNALLFACAIVHRAYDAGLVIKTITTLFVMWWSPSLSHLGRVELVSWNTLIISKVYSFNRSSISPITVRWLLWICALWEKSLVRAWTSASIGSTLLE